MLLMLVDASWRYSGGPPDPDDERKKRWQAMDKRISLPFFGALASLTGAASATSSEGVYAFTVAACALTFVGARYALKRDDGPAGGARPASAEDAEGDSL